MFQFDKRYLDHIKANPGCTTGDLVQLNGRDYKHAHESTVRRLVREGLVQYGPPADGGRARGLYVLP